MIKYFKKSLIIFISFNFILFNYFYLIISILVLSKLENFLNKIFPAKLVVYINRFLYKNLFI